MILISGNNIEKIKKIHKAYFDKVVKIKLNEVIKNNERTINDNVVKFIKNFLYIKSDISEKRLDNICIGNIGELKLIIEDFEEKYNIYLEKSTPSKQILEIIDKYIEYFKKDGYGKEEDRSNRWQADINKIKEIINREPELKNRDKIKKELQKEINFANKKILERDIKNFKKIFIVDDPIEILKKIFNYDVFSTNKNHEIIVENNEYIWNRHRLITMLGVEVCPYCNRQFISHYLENDNKKKTTADLDHFYSQSEYPFLALSLYNFIPSCQICNSRFKIADNFYNNPHIYPYTEEFGESAKFKTSFYTEKDTGIKENMEKLKDDDTYDIRYLLGNSDNFKIELKPEKAKSEKGKKIQNSIDTFHLEDLYNFHKDYVRELIKKAIIYNESRIDELHTQYPELFKSREEVLQMVVSNYIDVNDLGKRPLAKLTKDICEELGLR